MVSCEWIDCPNEATKVIERMATDEEQEESTRWNSRGVIVLMLIQRDVCDEHAEKAKELSYSIKA